MLVTILSALIIAFVATVIIRGWARGTYELASFRNIFLVGFVYFYAFTMFQFSRGQMAADLDYKAGRAGASAYGLDQTVIWLAVMIAVFLIAAAWGYKRTAITKRIPTVRAPLGSAMILGVAIAGATLALAFAAAPPGGYVGLLAAQFRTGLAALGTALATYYLISQRFNPLSWAIFAAILLAAVLATTVGGIGRRGVLSVILAATVTAYFTDFRYRSFTFKVTAISSVAIAGFLFILAYTTVRQDYDRSEQFGARAVVNRFEQLPTMFNLRNMRDAVDGVIYQDAAFNTAFIIDRYPQYTAYRGFRDAVYVVTMPVPRALWPEKPEALGIEIQEKMNSQANLAPGIVGHGWAAAGPFGVIIFGGLFGFAVGIADRKIDDNRTNPWMLAIFTSNLGNVLALPRGDTALFTIQILASISSAAVLVIVAKPILAPVGRAMKPVVPPTWRRTLVHTPAQPAPHQRDAAIQTTSRDKNWAAAPVD